MITNVAAGVQAFTSNAFLVAGERTVLVDAGTDFDSVGRIREHVDDLDAVLLTHTHPDHVGNLAAVTDAFDVEAWGYDTDQEGVDRAIADEEPVAIGDDEYVALHTPGHKNDHLVFYSAAASTLFAGDLIFQNGGYGRTDLAEGDHDRLVESLDRVATTVGDDLDSMHCGHGPSVTGDAYEHVEAARRAARLG